jgi:acetyl/propionyl-CoA carboxylase alpha subunit
MVDKLLIVPRGELATRIARTCKRLGVGTVAVHPHGQDDELHVDACDESQPVACNDDGTLAPEEVIRAAREAGADAVHPGYGPDPRHGALASAAAEAELTFLGSSGSVLDTLTDHGNVHEASRRAEVRTVPSATADPRDLASVVQAAESVGYPVLLKSRSSHVPGTFAADDEDELEPALGRARAAWDAYDLPPMQVEHHIARPRLLVLTTVADQQGGVASLIEREASARSRTLGLLEESPSPLVMMRHDGEAIRHAAGDAAIRVMRELGIEGLGSATFMLDIDGWMWLLQVETGLPAQHGVVEMVTGLDLVELQIRVARGEALEEELKRIQPSGNAFGVDIRVDPKANEQPGDVEVTTVRWPAAAQGRVRVEPAVHIGSKVDRASPALLLRTTTYAPIRHQALLTLDRMLAATHVEPLKTNIPLLRRVLGHKGFTFGQYDTDFVSRLNDTEG